MSTAYLAAAGISPALGAQPPGAGRNSEDAFENGASDEEMLDTVLPWLPPRQTLDLAAEAIRIYVWDRIGSDN